MLLGFTARGFIILVDLVAEAFGLSIIGLGADLLPTGFTVVLLCYKNKDTSTQSKLNLILVLCFVNLSVSIAEKKGIRILRIA